MLAQRIIPELESKAEPLEHDSSTNNLIRRYRKQTLDRELMMRSRAAWDRANGVYLRRADRKNSHRTL